MTDATGQVQRPRPAPPDGTWSVAAGLVILGVSSFAFLAVSGRALGPERFAQLAVFWMVLHTVGPGLFLPLEQELARVVATRGSRGEGSRDVLRQGVAVTAAATGLLGVACLLAGGAFARAFLQGSGALLVILLLGTAAMGTSYVARGVFAGLGAWRRYGSQLAVDGVLRCAGAIALAVVGVRTTSHFAVVLVLAIFLATLVATGRPARYIQPGSSVGWRSLGRAVGWLVVASLAGLALLNAAPLAVELLTGATASSQVGSFVAALVVARIPLFLFSAVQAALLPSLTRRAAAGDTRGFARALRELGAVVAALGLVMVGATAAVGPELLRACFGSAFQIGRVDLVLLVCSTVGFMLVTSLGQALVALQRYRSAALAPGAGLAVFTVVAVFLDAEPARTGAVALLAAVVVTTALLGRLVRTGLRHGQPTGA